MPRTTGTVVCIEDDPDIITLIQLMLRSTGLEIIAAVGGREGLEKIRSLRPDLVLLDLMMPDIDGWQVFDEMQTDADIQGIPVVVVTARSSIANKQQGFKTFGMDNYITKPIVEQSLLRSVNRAMELDPM